MQEVGQIHLFKPTLFMKCTLAFKGKSKAKGAQFMNAPFSYGSAAYFLFENCETAEYNTHWAKITNILRKIGNST